MTPKAISIAVDAMGADGSEAYNGVSTVVAGCRKALSDGLTARLVLFGKEGEIRAAFEAQKADPECVEIVHTDGVVTMDDKPTQVMRRGRDTSMWGAVQAVKSGDVQAAVSCGNTGALMAVSVLQLRMIEGVDRPAITAVWPTKKGQSIVLDVGANVEATAKQLVQFAIMGEAYYRAHTNKVQPTVGLLNVGAEELKGHELIRSAAQVLREADSEMAFHGFVEGNDISMGTVDVIVTDGFTGNITLKAAEGTARMVGDWVRDALTENIFSKLGALLMMRSLKNLKERMNPSNVNGAPLLGLNGLVIKSHGGTDAAGFAAALKTAERLARHPFQEEIKTTIAKVAARVAENEELQRIESVESVQGMGESKKVAL